MLYCSRGAIKGAKRRMWLYLSRPSTKHPRIICFPYSRLHICLPWPDLNTESIWPWHFASSQGDFGSFLDRSTRHCLPNTRLSLNPRYRTLRVFETCRLREHEAKAKRLHCVCVVVSVCVCLCVRLFVCWLLCLLVCSVD